MGMQQFAVGTKVIVGVSHWDKSVHGRVGTVYSVSIETVEGGPSPVGTACHYVKLCETDTAVARGQWVSGDELVAR
jgi:hypothetical protein